MNITLDGQVAIVTGASSGIGLGIAAALADAGAAVTVNYNSHAEPAQRLVDQILSDPGRRCKSSA
jgi:glucose 1-dehydrogenase